MNSLEVEAFIFDQKIGTILLQDGITYFEYDKRFKTSGLEISPLKLPLSLQGAYTNYDDKYFEGLAGVFHDTLPDKFGTKVIQRYFEEKNIPSHKLNALQKLMFVSDKSMGAISYKPAINTNAPVSELIELQSFYENAKKIVNGDAIEVANEMLTFMDSAASAGGARAKAIVSFNKTTKEMISTVHKHTPKDFEPYLLKFDMAHEDGSSSDYTKVEYLYMQMAKEAGIDIPEISLLEHGNLAHYLIKRFDRVGDESLHLHSVAGLTHTNFNLPMHYSYDELLRLTRYLTGSQNAVTQQFRRMVFNIIGRNQDDHAKNFAFTMNKLGIWDISPAYDITYANGTGYTKNHQLSLKGKTNDFVSQDIIDLALAHSIDKRIVKEVLEQTQEIFSTFANRAQALEIKASHIKRIESELRLDL